MKRLIFHIGQPKTGSTSLQYFLAANRLALAEQGIAYPSFRGSSLKWQNRLRHKLVDRFSNTLPASLGWESNHTNLSYEIGYARDSEERFSPARLTFAKLQDFILGCAEDTIIVSSESLLYFKRMQAKLQPLAEAVTTAGTDIEVVCFLRPQHQLMSSFYAQVTKRLTNDLPFAEFCEDFLTKRHRAAGTKLNDWRVLPRTKITPLPFTRARLEPNIETVFFTTLGLDDRIPDLLRTAGGQVANESPGPMTIEACRRATHALSASGEDISRIQRRHFSKAINAAGDRLGWNAEKFNGIDAHWCERIRTAFADQNEKLAKRHWGEPWHEVFASDYEGEFISNEITRDRTSRQLNELIDETVQHCARQTGIKLPATPD